jgi:hypothetical protein
MNLLLHVANGILVWALLRRLVGRQPSGPPLLGALAFLLHPVATESVAWISSRGDVLALTFMLAGLLLHLRSGTAGLLLSALCYLLALFSKESAVVLPLLLALMDWFEGGAERVRSRLGAYGLLALVAVGLVALRLAVLGGEEFGQRGGLGLPFSEVLFTIPSMHAYYVWNLVAPLDLRFALNLPTAYQAPLTAALGCAIIGALLLVARSCRTRAREVCLGIFLLLAALVPVTFLQIVFPFKILVAIRFAYPALVGVAVLAAWAAGRGRALMLLVTLAVAVLAPLTWARARDWRSEQKLWTSVLADDPRHPVALFGLGVDAMNRGSLSEARGLLIRSVELDPVHPQVHAHLGDVFERLAGAAPSGSTERVRNFRGALYAYTSAVDLWRGGAPDDPHLYRPTLLNAAFVASLLGERRRARDLARTFLETPRPLPDAPTYRAWMIDRIARLTGNLRRAGEVETADRLSGLVRSLGG